MQNFILRYTYFRCRCDYGGFTNEAYEELVRFHRNKEIPKRLHGHLKHRIDCFKRKAKRFQLIEGTDQLIYIGNFSGNGKKYLLLQLGQGI